MDNMGGDLAGLAAVTLIFGFIPAMIAYYLVCRMRSQERLAAIAKGVDVPMEPDISQAARSRRAGLLLLTGALGYITTFLLIARVEPQAWQAASFGAIPLAIGIGFFIDATLVRREAHS